MEETMARSRGTEASITSGIAFTLVFGVLMATQGGWWWIFPLVFAGVLPLLNGVAALMRSRRGQAPTRLTAEDAERAILELARDQGGAVYPAQIVVATTLSLKEAEAHLNTLVTSGYASVDIDASGRMR